MNITTLINTFRDAIHDDPATQAWCVANYGRAHKVYKGMDKRNPPGKDDTPLVDLFKVGKTAGYALEDMDHAIGVICELYDADGKTIDGKVNIVELESVDLIEAFRKLTETVIVANIPDGMWIQEMEVEYNEIEFFPFISAVMIMRISKPYHQGMDIFE